MPTTSKQPGRPPSTGHVDVGLWIVGAVIAVSAVIWTAAHLIGLARGRRVTLDLADAGQLLVVWSAQLAQRAPGPNSAMLAASSSADLPASDGAVQVVALVLVLLAGAAATAIWRWRPGGRRAHRTGRRAHQSARWGERGDLRSILVQPGQAAGRLVLGTFEQGLGRRLLVAVEQLHSVFVLGPTQSRKTSALAIPVLLEWEGCAIATSVKRDLLDATVGARWQRGDVWVFDPGGYLDEDGATWDILDSVTSWAKARELARWLTEAAAETKQQGDATKGFFERRGERPLAAALWAAAISHHGIGQVRRWLDELGAEPPRPDPGEVAIARYNDAAEEILLALSVAGEVEAIASLKSVLDETERQRSGTITSAQDALDAFADENVERACTPGRLAGGRIDADRLLDGAGTLYLYAPLHEQSRLRPVFEALIMSVVRTAMERTARTRRPLDIPLLVLLDEAGNIAPVRQLAQIASTGAGQGIQLLTVWQDMAQLVLRYGREADTVANNHRAKVVLSGLSDPSSLEYVSRLIGEAAEVETSTTRGEDRESTTEHVAYRRLAPPAMLRGVRPGEGVLVYGHLPACRLRLRWWEADQELARLAGPINGGMDGTHPGGQSGGDRPVVDIESARRSRRAS